MTRDEAMEYARELLVRAAGTGDAQALSALAALAVFQPERNSGADRTARWRARKRCVTPAVTPGVTVDVTRCDVTDGVAGNLNSSSVSSQILEPLASLKLSSRPESEDRAKTAKAKAFRAEAWAVYSEAYAARYGVEPVRNATVNAQFARFCARVPSPLVTLVVTHYVTSQNARYVNAKHSVGCMLQDAEKLCTEAQTGQRGTASQARRADHEADKQQRYTALVARLDAEAKAGATTTDDNPFAEIIGPRRLPSGGK